MARQTTKKQLDIATTRRQVLDVVDHLEHIITLARSAAGTREPRRAAMLLAHGIGDLAPRLRTLRTVAAAATGREQLTPEQKFDALKAKVLEIIREAGTVTGGADSLRARVRARKSDVVAAVAELAR